MIKVTNQTKEFVSVPSRGILFPNTRTITFTTAKATVCFRPLSGHLISKLNILRWQEWVMLWFPSPLGASYFQILPARARYFAGFSNSFAWQIIFLYIFLISNIHNRLQMQYLCGARQNFLFF